MRKSIVILITFNLFLNLNAQKDSLQKIRFSGIQLDIGPNIYLNFKQQSVTDYRSIVKNDRYLNADLRDFKSQETYFYRSFQGLLSLKFYADLASAGKLKKEIFIGLRYGQEFNGGLYFKRESYDTLGMFSDVNSGLAIYRLLSTSGTYNFGIHSQKLSVPIGFNITTNKQRFFWFTAGLEIAPSLNFGYQFTSSHSESQSEILIYPGDTIGSQMNYTQNSNHLNVGTWRSEQTKLSGVGFGLSTALPLCVYFHPFKRAPFLKHIHIMGSITPLYIYSKSKYSGSASSLNISGATGIRYNW